jgi:hypothetical protein
MIVKLTFFVRCHIIYPGKLNNTPSDTEGRRHKYSEQAQLYSVQLYYKKNETIQLHKLLRECKGNRISNDVTID